ncbi:16S rRNA (cytidine(1402)-2'-O)-methyltransferase [Propionispora hippei]|uniref:Ribosomal RNA small subunit methyltransferase I n=1 Tax=Propionispora hippei DSM 15287 TaxID=1123003 RepID=A0A1M6BL37_9FIRM|nr:16S rRNA (cytidine(1402)-2'-O)-methyltransferase [Propionispora hippei]SHI49432.1 16S rRNA (cytidine1402-2'-O)-methyltransferase [Propionispora hippei DSM 15287]
MTREYGRLFLCATPIGNLEDMTYRAVRTLKEVTVIAAEDTRHTRKLLSHFDIHTPLVSYHEHNKEQRGPELVARLLNGEDIAAVSDAGMPGISDPGVDLARLAIEQGILVIPVPGANAALSALVCSGLDTTAFTFLGFLPKTKKKRQELLGRWATHSCTMVFYESPHRLMATLAELQASFGRRRAVAARELTKKFEEFVRGDLQSLAEYFTQQSPRGEFTLVVEGCPATGETESRQENLSPVSYVEQLIRSGKNKKDAIRLVASELGLPKREVYQAVIELKDH